MVSSDLRKEVGWTKLEFPAPLEVWVVSYELISKWGSQDKEEFPSPLEVWVVSYRIPGTRNHKYARFPSPLEVWVVSYPISCIPKGKQYTR